MLDGQGGGPLGEEGGEGGEGREGGRAEMSRNVSVHRVCGSSAHELRILVLASSSFFHFLLQYRPMRDVEPEAAAGLDM